MVLSKAVLSEGGIIVESDELARRGFDPSEHRQHERNGLSGGVSSEPGGECVRLRLTCQKGVPENTVRTVIENITTSMAALGVRLHDLRHAYPSFGAGASLGLPIIGELLGHTQAQTTQR
jgi:integrase